MLPGSAGQPVVHEPAGTGVPGVAGGCQVGTRWVQVGTMWVQVGAWLDIG